MKSQVKNEIDLLQLMLKDMKLSSNKYNPTNYWSVYEKEFLPELLALGLHVFRQRRNSILNKFGATDLIPEIPIDFYKIKLFFNRFTKNSILIRKFLTSLNRLQCNIFLKNNIHKKLNYVKKESKNTNKKDIDQLSISLNGNPEHFINYNGNVYTLDSLYRYLCYSYCSYFINFDKINLVVELGSGSGKQIEVLKKLHPNLTFIVFDIAPQLYICEQYLKSIFPDSVVSYRNTRNIDNLSFDKGNIYIFGAYQFELIKNIKVDLFWNCCSFQEMEPEVVLNYLNFVNLSAKHVYLAEIMEGKNLADKPGDRGVLKKTTLDHYKQGLSNFKLKDLQPHKMPTSDKESNSFWTKNN